MSDIATHPNTIDPPVRAADLIGVLVLTVTGWRYIYVGQSREAAEAIAEEARDSKRYLKVRIN